MPEQVGKREWREDPPTEDFPLTVEVPAGAVNRSDDRRSLEGPPGAPNGAEPGHVDGAYADETTNGRPVELEETDDDNRAPPRAAAEERFAVPIVAATTPRRRRRRRWLRVLAAVGVLAVLGLVAWRAIPLIDIGGRSEVPVTAPAPAAAPVPVAFGEQVARPDGWTVQIEPPTAVRPSDGLDLPTDVGRAVRLEITLTNASDQPRDSAGWIVKATVDSRPVDLLPADAAAAPSRTILPEESLRFTIAVPMPAEEYIDLQVEAGPAGSSPALFVGQA